MAITTNNLISRQTVGSAGAASITFSNIPTTFTDLKIVMSIKSPTTSAAYEVLGINFTTSTSYSARHLVYWFATALSGANTTFTKSGTTYGRVFDTGFNTLSSTYVNPSIYSSIEIYVPNYRSANYKSYSAEMASENNSASDGGFLEMTAGLSSDTAAISAITLAGRDNDFMQFSTFSLYGISSNTSTQNTSVPSATGGDVITTDGTYWYHAFKYSGTFTPLKALTADCLVVAGGGGGSGQDAGGGGAGGLFYSASNSLTVSNHTVTIGSGGAGGPAGTFYTNASSGNNSQFGSLTAAVGGGFGSNSTTATAGTGGSGGGAGQAAGGFQAGGSATSGQGNAGGSNGTSGGPNYGSGAGGGAGAVGANGSNTAGGIGGVGSSTYSSWGSATSTGQNVSGTYYYAGGGAGGAYKNGGAAAGGYGGGGAAGSSATGQNSPGVAGTANTGGGGGSAGRGTDTQGDMAAGGAGGSGIVIVRYAV